MSRSARSRCRPAEAGRSAARRGPSPWLLGACLVSLAWLAPGSVAAQVASETPDALLGRALIDRLTREAGLTFQIED